MMLAFIAFVIIVSAFTVYKSQVVGMDGYGFDAMFAAWDHAIFSAPIHGV